MRTSLQHLLLRSLVLFSSFALAYPPITTYKEPLRLSFELELMQEGMERVLPYFKFSDPEIERLSVSEKAALLLKDVSAAHQTALNAYGSKLLNSMKLRDDVPEEIKTMFSKLEWTVGGDCVEFRHKTYDTSAADYWHDLERITAIAGVDKKFFDPQGNNPGPWFSVHLNHSFPEHAEIRQRTASSLNLLKLFDYLQIGRGESALSEANISFKQTKDKGLFSTAKGIYETRSYPIPPKQEFERMLYFTSLPEDVATRQLARIVLDKIESKKLEGYFEIPTKKRSIFALELLNTMAADPQILKEFHNKVGDVVFKKIFDEAMLSRQPLESLGRLSFAVAHADIPSEVRRVYEAEIHAKVDGLMEPLHGRLIVPTSWMIQTALSKESFEGLPAKHQLTILKELLKINDPDLQEKLSKISQCSIMLRAIQSSL